MAETWGAQLLRLIWGTAHGCALCLSAAAPFGGRPAGPSGAGASAPSSPYRPLRPTRRARLTPPMLKPPSSWPWRPRRAPWQASWLCGAGEGGRSKLGGSEGLAQARAASDSPGML